MDLMTEEQLERYEAFRRSSLGPRNVKRVHDLIHFDHPRLSLHASEPCNIAATMTRLQVLQTIAGQNVAPPILLVMRGMAKVYVGELVEAGGRTCFCMNGMPQIEQRQVLSFTLQLA